MHFNRRVIWLHTRDAHLFYTPQTVELVPGVQFEPPGLNDTLTLLGAFVGSSLSMITSATAAMFVKTAVAVVLVLMLMVVGFPATIAPLMVHCWNAKFDGGVAVNCTESPSL